MNAITTVADAKRWDSYLAKATSQLGQEYDASYAYFQGDEDTIEYCEMSGSPVMDFSMYNGKEYVKFYVYVNTSLSEFDKFLKSNQF